MRSCFAMSEPDVASSDPTNLGTRIVRDREDGGDAYVLNGRKWFTTGAGAPPLPPGHRDGRVRPRPRMRLRTSRHSLLLVPMDAPGVQVVRNIPVMQHQAIEGHCEIVFQGVRVSAEPPAGRRGRGLRHGAGAAGAGPRAPLPCAPSASASWRWN
jgi:acyl-CoA dehydrogenase